ncbi:ABC transporter ATP-binding protein [Actinoplanes xinjiangensis]|uniref:Peptide/nickel transport system ATP-binding protein n=1 Tax=Actinoplanes xinjiangensis TaxID=512350 RepID=A0A316EM79_9ACTN|nr:ABC transporter ATP-binding protein [Actinoplanes xinjiangensis]PWK31722.1 peptide/nickel transport system ATP-binding protein [Actinoplanes xinjiangensis]GIF43903.1 ABC transporter ATP-binding protein [Actinoplanes xinjiangensis]
MTLLTATGVTKRYPSARRHPFGRRPVRTVLDAVDLAVSAGERLGIVGGSGAGKSTLLRLLLAVEAPDTGEVRFRGRPVRPARPGRLGWFRREVQFVAQDPYASLSPRMTVRDIIGEPLHCLRVPGDRPRRIDELLRAVRLDPALASRLPSALSGGQRQRVALARALAPRPAVLVADEPISALDAPVRVAILDLLREVTVAEGSALVLVAHDLAAVRRACTRVMVLDQGRVVESGPVDQVFHAPRSAVARDLIEAIPRLPGEVAR